MTPADRREIAKLPADRRRRLESWDDELRERFVAHARRDLVDQARGLTDYAVGIRPGESWWTSGMAGCAEDYAADVLGVPRNLNNEHPDAGWDLVWCGLTVDVKWRPARRDLIAPVRRRLRADLYLLVVGTDPRGFDIPGWDTGRRLMSSVMDIGYGDTFVIRERHLMSPRQLIEPVESWW